MASLPKRGVRVHFKNVACIAGMIFSAVFAQASSSDVVLYASKAPVKSGKWAVVADSTAAGGYAIGNTNLGAAKINTALATPKN
jgi:hypothetical protein